jgi:hypothetical protein
LGKPLKPCFAVVNSGAKSATITYTLIETVKLDGVDPQA